MTISKDLLLAILSLDAYKQGYNRGIEHGKTNIGSATQLDAPEGVDESLWEEVSFYAISYDTPFGTVISYRGTDNFSPVPWDTTSDVYRGWITGCSTTDPHLPPSQQEEIESAYYG